jgi:raffinose/stachyose/melibiose transport system substrate-binding protein
MKSISRFSIMFLIVCAMILNACQTNAGTTQQPTTESVEQPTVAAAEQPTAETVTQPTEVASQPSTEAVELSFFIRLSEPGDIWPDTIDRFNANHEGKIHVTMSYVDDTTYHTKLPILLRSDTPPDVFFSWEGGYAKDIIDAGFAEPLDRYFDRYGWADRLNPGALSLSIYDGTKYLVPYYMSSAAVWYRPDILAKYNLDTPTTWDELLSVCQTLKDNGVSCWMLANKENWVAQFDWCGIFVNKYGVNVYNDLINRKLPWTDPRVVDALQTLKDFVDAGYVYPNPNSIGLLDGNIPFAQGDAAFWYQGSWMPQVFGMSEAPFEFAYLQFPTFPPQTPTMEVFAEETLMIGSASTHKDEAAEFVDWVISDEIQTLRTTYGYFPSVQGIDLSAMNPPILQELGKTMSEAGPYTYMHLDHALSQAVATEMLDSLQAVIGGAMTPEDAAASFEAAANSEMGPVTP